MALTLAPEEAARPPAAPEARPEGLRVLVVCGGPGAEREVSLESGRQAHAALTRRHPGVALHDVRGPADLEGLSGDVAVMMLHGEFGEDGDAPRRLAARGLSCTGPEPGDCARALDKDAAKRAMAAAGVRVAPWGLWRPGGDAREAWARAGGRWPVIVKPNARGSSVGVSRVDGPEGLEGAVARAAAYDPEGVMVEAFVEGREFTAAVLDGEALPLVEILCGGHLFDYRLKYGSGEARCVCPAELDPGTARAWREMARVAARALRARDLCRVDFLADGQGPVALEVNTAPGFTAHSLAPLAAQAAGIGFEELCGRLVRMAAARIPVNS